MGMYTQLFLAVSFKEDTPDIVVSTLGKMVDGSIDTVSVDPLPNHPFFLTSRWTWCLRSGGSAYFDGVTFCNFSKGAYSKEYQLTMLMDIKNYSQEWEKFLDWISPYLETEGYLGFYRYEEWEEPMSIFRDSDGTITRGIK